MEELQVINHNNIDVIDSREVAEMIGKEHRNLIRDIRGYVEIIENSTELKIEPSDFFFESNYKDSTGRTLPCYLLTRKGCDMVANKMTGEKGVLFTAAYVTAFEEMQKRLKMSPSPAEQLLAQAQLTLEEKILAVQQAQAKLANAQNERTVRQFNARTGQWEWVADQKEVDSAQEALDEAKKDLEDFKANMAYEAALAELEAQKKTINERYDDLETAYKDFLKSIKEKTRGIGEILQDIWKNATPELRQIIQENAELFRQFGIDVSQLSDAVNDTAHKIVRVGAGGKAPSGLSVGDRVVTGGGTYEITGVNPDGSYTSKLVDANQTIWNYGGQYDTVSGNNSGNTTGGGQKYTGTVWAKRNDGNGVDYKISSARGLDFLNNEPAGATMTGSDGSYWVKNADGTTSITNKYGVGFTVYDKGGILRGMGGIKATMQDEGITPPDVTTLLRKRLLKPIEDKTFSQNMDQIRWMMASNGMSANEVHNASYDSHNIGTMIAKQINCTINGMKVSPQEAHVLTLEKLANIAHNLGNFS